MLTRPRHRRGLIVSLDPCTLAIGVLGLFAAWITAGVTEARTQYAALNRLHRATNPSMPIEEWRGRYVMYEDYFVGFRGRTPWWNARRPLYEITRDWRFQEVVAVHFPGQLGMLDGNTITGAEWKQYFESFRFAREIRLGDCGIHDLELEGLASMRKLETLNLDSIPISGEGFIYLQRLPALRTLGLGGVELSETGARLLGRLTGLESLHLWDIDADAILPELTSLRNLKTLNLNGATLTDDALVYVGKMEWLTCIDLRYTHVSGEGLRHLKNLTALTSLKLRGTKVTDRSVHHLTNLHGLTYLDLSETAVTDEALPQLHRLTNLEYLELCGTHATAARIKKLVDAMPRLEVIWLIKEWTEDSDEQYGIATGKAHGQ